MTETTQLLSSISLCSKVEALLFVASEALSIAQLAELLGVKQVEVNEALNELRALYVNRGLKLQEFNNRYQITTTPEVSEIIEKMLGLEATTKLSKAALESLAVIAYRQPVTRPGIDAIRGVNSDGVLKSLLSKGLIEEVGRADTPGRPILYGVTDLFLQHFGLEMLSALPPFELEEEVSPSGSNGILKD